MLQLPVCYSSGIAVEVVINLFRIIVQVNKQFPSLSRGVRPQQFPKVCTQRIL